MIPSSLHIQHALIPIQFSFSTDVKKTMFAPASNMSDTTTTAKWFCYFGLFFQSVCFFFVFNTMNTMLLGILQHVAMSDLTNLLLHKN